VDLGMPVRRPADYIQIPAGSSREVL